ncbi:hypothetical protein H0H92_011761 [Tricholoma furcatifolium]|nr:hypothetical protein H0H92_011761 [Tricholoma furcatifolium]
MSIASTRTRPLANRLLFPSLHAPPPLLSASELDDDVYDFLALALRAYVVPWWSKLSRYDKQLLPEITRILTVVIRNLDARIHALDINNLLLTHAPALITQHYRDYRNAHAKLRTSYAAGAAASLPQLFHQLQPHMAISADGRLDTEYFRHLIDHVLMACLPEEDYKPKAERFIVREIILKVLLNDVIPKITQPWFIHRHRQVIPLSPCLPSLIVLQLPQRPRSSSTATSNHFSFQTIIVLVLSAIQAISGACLALIHTYKNTLSTIKSVNKRHPPSPQKSFSSPHNYASPPLTMFSEVFTLHERTTSTILLTSTRVVTDFSSSFLDRLLPHLLEAQLSPAFILSIIRLSKRTLFPSGYPGPPPIEPTLEEQAELRARLVGWRPRGALASRLLPLLLGPDPTKTLGAAIDPLSSAPCNVHLVLFLIDLVVLELFPELALPVTDGSRGGGSDASLSLAHDSSGGGSTPVGGRDGDSVTASEAS